MFTALPRIYLTEKRTYRPLILAFAAIQRMSPSKKAEKRQVIDRERG
jgi:hypothetical protein